MFFIFTITSYNTALTYMLTVSLYWSQKSASIMEPEAKQEIAAGPYTEPAEINLYPHILFLYDHTVAYKPLQSSDSINSGRC
jgi:hypothetical protein